MEAMCGAMEEACDEAAAEAGLPPGSAVGHFGSGSGSGGSAARSAGGSGLDSTLLERVHVLQARRGAEVDARWASGETSDGRQVVHMGSGVGMDASAAHGAARLRAACAAHGRHPAFRQQMVLLHERQLARYKARGLELDFHGGAVDAKGAKNTME